MTKKFSSLFQYLKSENISINEDEFEFQAQSHPDYPSILSIIDTLSFFNISNGALSVEKSEIELLPDHFLALLEVSNSEAQFYFVERKGEFYYFIKDKKVISRQDLELIWKNIVILVEKTEIDNSLKSKKNSLSWILPSLCIGLFLITLAHFQISLTIKLFFIFPIFGILCSIAALKDLFGTKSKFLNNFCNLASNSSCTTVVESNKWKIFEIVNFSDLSIIFFSTQFFTLLLYILMVDEKVFFSFNQIMLFCALPLIIASIYYQKIVEKKWCPICLSIISIILLELAYIIIFLQFHFVSDTTNISIFGFVITSVTLAWFVLKKILIKQKHLKEYQITSNRFIRNYEVFKNNLLSKGKTKLAYSPIILGNKESDIEIAVITSPFCSYCKGAHEILEKILLKNKTNLKIKILINANFEKLDNEKKIFFRILMAIYLNKGEDFFLAAFHDWFENKNLQKWIEKNNLPYNEVQIDSIYESQNQWCIDNNVHFTPAFFINEYSYPTTYERESLLFFINDLIDEDFLVESGNSLPILT